MGNVSRKQKLNYHLSKVYQAHAESQNQTRKTDMRKTNESLLQKYLAQGKQINKVPRGASSEEYKLRLLGSNKGPKNAS